MVEVAVAGGSTSTSESSYSGVVSARVQSDLGFRVSGKVVERLVDARQKVRRGQALMRIDRNDLALANASQTSLVAAARAKAMQTDADERRYRDLVSGGAVSASTYDQIKAAAIAARNDLASAQAQAGVTANQASYSVLRADADGVVVETLAEPGAVVTAGQTVVRLAHAGPREATVNLAEGVRPAIGTTAKATLYGTSISGTARLRQLSDAADPQTRTYDARYVLEGAAAEAPLGSTVAISLADGRQSSNVRVPLSAVFDSGRGPGVWIVSGKSPTVTWRPVRIASLGDETAAIADGLRAGEKYVALGAHLLHPSEHIRIAPTKIASR
jgi:RND family efflux transporter MFP subunit